MKSSREQLRNEFRRMEQIENIYFDLKDELPELITEACGPDAYETLQEWDETVIEIQNAVKDNDHVALGKLMMLQIESYLLQQHEKLRNAQEETQYELDDIFGIRGVA